MICEKAIVLSEANETEYKFIYTIKVISKNIKLLLYTDKDYKKLEYGDLIEVKGKYEQPSSIRNYKGFNYKKYLKQKNVYGIIRDSVSIEVIEQKKIDIINLLSNRIAKHIINRTIINLPTETEQLCVGILIGEDNNIQDNITESFQKSSLTHLLAVSGSHISYIIICFAFILSKIKINKRIISICTIFALLLFMFITGFTSSVVRACIMGIILLGGKILYRKVDIITSLSLALLIILIFNPYIIQNTGLQLSFLGVLGIVIYNKKISVFLAKKTNKNLAQLISVTLSAQIMIIPIMIYQFNTISITFIISNVLAIPISGAIVILGFICALLPVEFLYFILNILLKLLIFISEFVSNFSISSIKVITPNIVLLVLYYLLLLINYSKINRKLLIKILILIKIINKKFFLKKEELLKIINYCIILLFIAIVICRNIVNILPKDLRINFIDVGQGDSTLIRTYANKVILIDGGGTENGDYDIGEKVLVPYLLDRGIKSIDFIIISHFDSDHVKGLFTVLEELNVKNVVISKQNEYSENYKDFLGIIKKRNIKLKIAKAGDEILLDQYTKIKILWPETNYIKDNLLNNNSIVFQVIFKDFTMLFTGDIEEIAEQEISKKYSTELKSTVIKIAHHGSKTSTSDRFLNLVEPNIALIGVGENNNFGHPNMKIIEKINKIRM